MESRSVDVVAAGPAPVDLYEPCATAWAFAAAMGARGDHVRVLYPAGPDGARPPDGVTPIPVPLTLRRPGSAVEPADFAVAAGRRNGPAADLVLRDPAGLGPLKLSRRPHEPPVLVAFVRSLELHAFEQERAGRPLVGFVDRLDAWRDRRAVRRLERASLLEADRLFCDAPGLPATLTSEYDIPEARLRTAVRPVPHLPTAPTRAQARGALRIPTDVPVVVTVTATDQSEPAGVDRVREAFRRIRSFFPGARLVIAGASAPTEPGVVPAPGRDGATFAQALASADVAVFARRIAGFDPGAVWALRAGVAAIVVPEVRWAIDPKDGVRVASSEDPGELASALAELLADPAERHDLAKRGATFVARFAPERVVDEVERSIV